MVVDCKTLILFQEDKVDPNGDESLYNFRNPESNTERSLTHLWRSCSLIIYVDDQRQPWIIKSRWFNQTSARYNIF